LPRPDDHSDGPSTLPAPELNPLLNPILGQNMGRWAEVYFTSPPEKREQAVLDLLRELQRDNPTPEVAAPSAVSEQESQPLTAPASRLAEVPVAMVRCQACGQENPASHRFCGMCGKPVVEQRAAADLNITDLHVVQPRVADLSAGRLSAADFYNAEFQSTDLEGGGVPRDGLSREDPSSDDRPSDDRRVAHLFAQDPAPLTPSSEPQFLRTATAVSEPALNSNEFQSARSGRELNEREYRPRDLFEPVMDSRPYRLYIGIGLAVVLVVAYVVWRSMLTSQSSHVALAPTTETTQPVTPAPTPPNSSTADTPDRTSEPASPANAQAAIPSNAIPSNNPANNAVNNPANNAGDRRRADALSNTGGAKPASPDGPAQAANPTSIDEKSVQAEAVSAHGAEELAIAQHYLNLNGAEGQERNSAEAAKWLWKAIAKHNADATLLLSDLYLKGDGVEKNCDQARVLLDAAAGRGMKGAGDRLRHLQAFGCQ
jgi:hypothetical protein